jgi:hypothetical protein
MSVDNKLNILIAYPYMKPEVIRVLNNNQDKVRFLLDSGAFTAWKAGKPVSLDAYCKFIESLPFKPWRYFTLDVIGNPEASFENYQTMLKRGFSPIPIFTRGEDIKMIEEYYKTSNVLGIGGLVGTQGNKGFVKGIMNIIGDRKVHWLGFVRHDFVNHYKPYMCDASSWSHASRNGDLKVYLGRGIIKSFRRKDFINKPDQKYLNLLKSYDINQSDLTNDANWKSHVWLNKNAARMWVRRSLETHKFLKSHLFLACASIDDLSFMFDGYNKEVKT